MAINESIVKRINSLNISEQAKKMLLDLLKQQERGARQYTKPYTAIIDEYLESVKND